MASNNCFACGSKLSFRSNREAICTNTACPGGGRYVRCGFCKEMSFAVRYPEAMMCINPRCKMHNVRRRVCPHCSKASLVTWENKEICINRNCPSNASIIDTCFFCGYKSFLRRKDLMFCTKGDCPVLLEEVRMCAFCGERSFVVKRESCQNRSCKMFDVRVQTCPQCGQRTAVEDPSAPGGLVCKNENCVQDAGVDMAGMTLDFLDVSQLKEEAAGQDPPANDGDVTQVHKPKPDEAEEGKTEVYRKPEDKPDVPPPHAAASPPPPKEEQPLITPETPEISPVEDQEEFVIQNASEEPAAPPPPPEPGSEPEPEQAAPAPPPPAPEPEPEQPAPAPPPPAPEPEPEQPAPAPPPPAPEPEPEQPAPAPPPPAPVPEPEQPAPAPPPPAPEPEPEQPAPAPPPPPSPVTPEPVAEAAFPPSNPSPPPEEEEEDEDEEEEEEELLVVRKKSSGKPGGRYGAPPAPKGQSSPPAAERPSPSPSPPPPGPSGTSQTAAFSTSPVSRVFRFLKENVLQDPQGRSYPLYLVIGLGGSGKTIYLTMLGDILLKRGKSYYFPYQGLGVEPVLVDRVLKSDPERFRAEFGSDLGDMLKGKVKDLVHEFSSEIFQKYLTKNLWAQHTPLEEDSTYFLITEITRNQRTLAKIATMETSGEAFESIIRGMTAGRLDDRGSNAIERVLNDMLDIAEGFVILVDPSREDNDEIYRNLFLALKQGIEPRAKNRYYREVKARLAGQTAGRQGVMGIVANYMKEQKDQAELQSGIQRRAEELGAKLEEIGAKFQDPDMELKKVMAEEEAFLTFFVDQSRECFPKEYEQAQGFLARKEKNESVFKTYFSQWVKLARSRIDEFAQFVYVQEQMKREADEEAARQTKEQKVEAARKVRQEFGVNISMDVEEALPDDREVSRFKNLKYIAVAITKSDMYPIIFPPDEYPRRKLAVCSNYLLEIENYLKFLGGEVRYYNTSATGYSVLRGTQFVPGHESTLTPINVIEPIFDMLDL